MVSDLLRISIPNMVADSDKENEDMKDLLVLDYYHLLLLFSYLPRFMGPGLQLRYFSSW